MIHDTVEKEIEKYVDSYGCCSGDYCDFVIENEERKVALRSFAQALLAEFKKEVGDKVIGEDKKERHNKDNGGIDACVDCIAVRHGNFIRHQQRISLEEMKI